MAPSAEAEATGNAEFIAASEDATKLPNKPDNDVLLKLYGLFKQATNGDNTAEKPGMFQLTQKAKWEAWEKLKGKLFGEYWSSY